MLNSHMPRLALWESYLLETTLIIRRIRGSPNLYRHTRTPDAQQLDLDPLTTAETEESSGSSTSRLPAEATVELTSMTRNEDAGERNQNQSRALTTRLRRPLKNRKWRFGLYAGLYASIAVLLSNIVLHSAGLATHDNNFPGITTIAKGGGVRRITAISTAYHALINVLSTMLLTTSNYAMQILCDANTMRPPERRSTVRMLEDSGWRSASWVYITCDILTAKECSFGCFSLFPRLLYISCKSISSEATIIAYTY